MMAISLSVADDSFSSRCRPTAASPYISNTHRPYQESRNGTGVGGMKRSQYLATFETNHRRYLKQHLQLDQVNTKLGMPTNVLLILYLQVFLCSIKHLCNLTM